MMSEMSAREYHQWKMYYKVSPGLFYRLDWLFATVCRMLAESMRNPEVRKDPFDETEFLLPWGMTKEEQERREAWQKQALQDQKDERERQAGQQFSNFVVGTIKKIRTQQNGSGT